MLILTIWQLTTNSCVAKMAGWSSLAKIQPSSLILRGFCQSINRKSVPVVRNGLIQQVRHGGDHRTMPLTASRWQWHKFKDTVHYYIMVGAIPLSLVILYANIFIGPAKLSEIPEGYVPKHWEYYSHPIQRFFARYIYTNPQQEYEKFMHLLYEEEEKRQMRLLEKKIKGKMAERSDYQAYYYRPAIAKYHRINKEDAVEYRERLGDN
ncbi:hypothetical protein B566_EDAN009321 [Ephemera danica]|nr:hypothetical protein B566_EDAN009321 [Ephemera danica]